MNVPVKVKTDMSGIGHLYGPGGRDLMSAKDFKFLNQGYVALTYADCFFYSREDEGQEPLGRGFQASEATLMKAVATYEFDLTIDNTGS
jgi:hypothetical protein